MRRGLKKTLFVFLWILVVTLLLTLEEAFRHPDIVQGDILSLENYLTGKFRRADRNKNFGSAAFVLVNDGKVSATKVFGLANSKQGLPADPDKTLYLLCSVSKAVTTWGVMKLVAEGRIGLDEPIQPYLERWKFLKSDPDFASKVTIRHLLSHTAGIDDGFGTTGFRLDEPVPTIESWLDHPADANMGKPHATVVTRAPGTLMSYSTAGYGILQLLIEDLTNSSFNDYMKEEVLNPLGLVSSTYRIEDVLEPGNAAHLADNYNSQLRPHAHRKFVNMAGVSLRMTPNDVAKFIVSYVSDSSLLSRESISLMCSPQPETSSAWALGHEVYGEKDANHWIVGHSGGGFPRTGAAIRINLASDNGIAILMTGGEEMIDPYLKDWTYWETGEIIFDPRNIIRNRTIHFLVAVLLGVAIILRYSSKSTAPHR